MEHRIRIIAGTARGRWIYSPSDTATRPMLVRIRNSLFNIIRPHLAGAKVLDLFAGTGVLGLEALSRGAAFCLFTEQHRPSWQILTRNVERLGFKAQAQVIPQDAFGIAEVLKRESFTPDIIFVSPPYKFFDDDAPERARLLNLLDKLVPERLVAPDGLIVVEHLSEQLADWTPDYLTLSDRRTYGQTSLTFLKD